MEGEECWVREYVHPSLIRWRFVSLVQVSARVPDFTPARVLDFGSGVGSAFWAIEAVWPRAVKESVAVEASRSMQELANALRAQVRSSPSGYRALKAQGAWFLLSQRVGKMSRAVCEAIWTPTHHVEAPA